MARAFTLPSTLDALRNYVDGAFVETGKCFDNVSPIDGRVLAPVHEADAALVDRAVRAARKAVDEGPWGRSTVGERADALHRVIRTHHINYNFHKLKPHNIIILP